MTVFKHSGALGDIVYSLPTIEALGGGVLWTTKPDQYRAGKSLFALQPCISEVRLTKYRKELVDMDAYRFLERDLREAGTPCHLAKCFALLFHVDPDFTKPWLSVPKVKRVAPIVVSRTLKYHDREEIDWRLLRGRPHAFVGFPNEWLVFDKTYDTGAIYYECTDLLEVAEVIAGCDLFIGNQSVGFAIAEALKVDRVLEVCYRYPNCMPLSGNGYTKLTKELLDGHCA